MSFALFAPYNINEQALQARPTNIAGLIRLSDNLPDDVMKQAESLFLQGRTVSEVAKLLRIKDTAALYERIRADSNLIRQRTVHYEIDLELLKYKVINTLTEALEDEKVSTRISAARALLDYTMPKKDKTDGMVVINFGMEPPRMPDSPAYIYESGSGVSNE